MDNATMLALMRRMGGGGGSGGVTSWNDLTDKPFGDNADGTVYPMSGKYVEGMGYREIGEGEIFPEQSLTFSEKNGASVAVVDTVLELIVGEHYTVVFDGTAYETVCVASEYSDVGLGNAMILGFDEEAEDTGEPFAVVAGGPSTFFVTTNPGGNYTISVRGKTEIIYPINDKFLPDIGGVLIIDADMNSMTTSLPVDDVLLAKLEGKYPVLKVPYGKNAVAYLPFVCKSTNGYSFSGYAYANSEWVLLGAAVSGNEIVQTITNQFGFVDIMHTANALRIKSTDGQKMFAIVVDGDGTIRTEEAV